MNDNGKFKFIVAGVILLCFIIIIYALAFRAIPESNKDVFIHTVGILEGLLVALVSYYFGSSSGSKDKSETIANALKTEQNKP